MKLFKDISPENHNLLIIGVFVVCLLFSILLHYTSHQHINDVLNDHTKAINRFQIYVKENNREIEALRKKIASLERKTKKLDKNIKIWSKEETKVECCI